MTIPEWLEKEGPGARMKLVRMAKISPTTATALGKGRKTRNYDVAVRVSQATRSAGGRPLVPLSAIWDNSVGDVGA